MFDGVNAHMEFTEEEDKERRKIREEEEPEGGNV